MYQQTVNAISQISFSTEEKVSPKKPTSIAEVAKQRELSGTTESELDTTVKKQLSEAKSKELSGNDIFGPPPVVPARPLAARNLELKGNLDFALPQPRNIHTSVKVSNVSEIISTHPHFFFSRNLLLKTLSNCSIFFKGRKE